MIAGLVHSKIYSVEDPVIESRTNKIINDTIEKIIHDLPINIQDNKLADFLTYQPLEDSYFAENIFHNKMNSNDENPHFQYTSSGPNFFERELRIMEERKAKEQSILAKRSPQITTNTTLGSSASSSLGSQNRSTTLSSGLRSLIQTEPKKSAKTISDAKVLVFI